MTITPLVVNPTCCREGESTEPHPATRDAEAGQLGTIIIRYRSGGFDRFPDAARASAEALAEKIYGDAGGFRGVARICDDECLAVINLAEVESIRWTARRISNDSA